MSFSALAAPSLTFTYGDVDAETISVPEANTNSLVQITATLSEIQTTDVVFDFQYQFGSAEIFKDFNFPKSVTGDFSEQAKNATITIVAGDPSVSFFIVNLLDDALKENDETLIFGLSSQDATIARSTITLTIVDNEIKPEILISSNTPGLERENDGSFIAAVNEDFGAVKLKLILNNDLNLSSTNMFIRYSISQEEGVTDIPDYNDPGLENAPFTQGVLVFPAELSEVEFDFPITSDTIPENQERIIFKLVSVDDDIGIILENLSIVTVIINDDDANAGVINDTNVTLCYDDIKNPITCDDPTSFFPSFGQDGSTHEVNDYVKLDAVGRELSSQATNANCVLDRNTNLVWEIKKDSYSYTWLNKINSVNGGDEGFEGGEGSFITCGNNAPCNTEHYAEVLRELQTETDNNVGLCNMKNWRLPKLKELLSIMDFEADNNSVLIDEQFFGTYSTIIGTPRTLESFYWTASPASVIGKSAWCVYFGKVQNNHIQLCDKTEGKLVRMVATCSPAVDSNGNKLNPERPC